MNVFRIVPNISYGGGSVLIAADDSESAIKLFCRDEYRKYQFEEYLCSCNQIPRLDYDTTIPMILFNDIYIE